MSAVERMKGKIESKDISAEDLLLFLEAIEEISRNNEDIQLLLEDMKEENEIIHLNISVTDADNLCGSLNLVDGEIHAKRERSEPSTLDLFISTEGVQKILRRELTIGQAYSQGLLKAKGNYTKILGLALILEKITEELNIA
jgi:alkyl sulfatase BDS1-like metallo-beta-lactamase superfamily hydrolase